MKIAEIRKLDTKSLTLESTKLREEISDLRHQLVSGQSGNVRALRGKRKDLARVLTVLTEQFAKEKI